MKSVLISIQPKWCELIASGKKTVEVRKNRPKVDTPFKVYIYETNWKDNTYWKNYHKDKLGKVIGEFVCNEIYSLSQALSGIAVVDMDWCLIDPDWFRDASCLTDEEVCNYLNDNDGFGWLISDLVIYDKPKELSEFHPYCNHADYCTECKNYDFDTKDCRRIKRPPQSWCYVEKE